MSAESAGEKPVIGGGEGRVPTISTCVIASLLVFRGSCGYGGTQPFQYRPAGSSSTRRVLPRAQCVPKSRHPVRPGAQVIGQRAFFTPGKSRMPGSGDRETETA